MQFWTPRHALAIGALVALAMLACACETNTGETGDEREESAGEESSAAAESENGEPTAEEPEDTGPEEIPLSEAYVPDDSPVHPVYSLFDNRVLAHPIVERGFAARLGAPEGAKYIWGGHPAAWISRRSLDDVPVAMPKGTGASFFVPLTADQAERTGKLMLRLYNLAELQQVSVMLNGTELGEVSELDEDAWHTLAFPVPADTAKPGENEIAVKYSNTGRAYRIRIGAGLAAVALLPADPPLDAPTRVVAALADERENKNGRASADAPIAGEDDDESTSEASTDDDAEETDDANGGESTAAADDETTNDESPADDTKSGASDAADRDADHSAEPEPSAPALVPAYGSAESLKARALDLPLNGGFGWYVMPYEDVELRFDLEAAPGCAVEVTLRPESGEPEAHVIPAPRLAARRSARIALEEHEGAVVRLDFVAITVTDATDAEAARCDPIRVLEPALVAPGEAPSVSDEFEPPHNILVWLVDTLRADHLPIYNPSTDVEAPNMVEWSENATVFERAYVQGNESKVSHASLFTGLYPNRHEFFSGSDKLRSRFELLPELAQRAELKTAGYISNGYISTTWGFNQGFDDYVNTIRESRRNNAPALVRLANRWLDRVEDARHFLYMGTIDPHVTYNRHEEFIDLYDDDDDRWRGHAFHWNCSGRELELITAGKLCRTDEEKARVHALYKNEITFNDKYFGELLKDLEERGQLEKTMVVVTADHGDEFWEHGSVGHAKSLYEDQVRVPLMISYPPLFPPGRVAEGVDVLDVHPTIADALRIERTEGTQGMSLRPLAHGVGGGYPRPAIATQRHTIQYAMLLHDWKVIMSKNKGGHLYNVARDPKEQKKVEGEHPMPFRWVKDSLGIFLAYRAGWDKKTMGVASNLTPGFYEAVAGFEEVSR